MRAKESSKDMGFFDFLPSIERYADAEYSVSRLNIRHDMLIEPLKAELAGARVLDLAAHDGRWAYAFAAAGAREVVGIEGRQHLVDRFAEFPAGEAHDRVTLKCGDIYAGMEAELAAGAQYDVVGVLGILYHVMDHFRLFQLVSRFKPRLVIVDSEFSLRPGPIIMLTREDPTNDLNALAQTEGQEKALIGIPSFSAMEAMADVLGYTTEWLDWNRLPKGKRRAVNDYYRTEAKRRGTCLLRPKA